MTNIVNPYRYVAEGSKLLDDYPGAKAAYSFRLLNSSYTGYCIKVRRGSDNAEQDIGFSGGVLDTSSLESFCSGTSGNIAVWYDQSGNGYNMVQTTNTNQPAIVSSGTTETFNGNPSAALLAQHKMTADIVGFENITNLTTFAVNGPADASAADTGTQVVWGYLNGGGSSTDFGISWGATTGNLSSEHHAMYFAHPSSSAGGRLGASSGNYTHSAGEHILHTMFNLSSGTSYYKNGSSVTLNLSHDITTSTNTSPAAADSGTSGEDDVHLNSINGANDGYKADFQELVFYDSDKTTDRADIESNINTFYSIY